MGKEGKRNRAPEGWEGLKGGYRTWKSGNLPGVSVRASGSWGASVAKSEKGHSSAYERHRRHKEEKRERTPQRQANFRGGKSQSDGVSQIAEKERSEKDSSAENHRPGEQIPWAQQRRTPSRKARKGARLRESEKIPGAWGDQDLRA